MRILWLSWKDEYHPEAGGAEKVSGEIRRRLTRDGHDVTLVTARYKGSLEDEKVDGVTIHRTGGRYSTYLRTWQYCRSSLPDWPDIVIDEMNTVPFVASCYYKNTPVYLLTYQLAREIWFYQMKFPFSLIGYLLEPIVLLLLSQTKYRGIITESESTKRDISRFGLHPISLFPVWLDLEPIAMLNKNKKLTTVLSLGAVRPMKRTLDAIKAFEHARAQNPNLHLVVAGDLSSSYAQKVKSYVESSNFSDDITLTGRVSEEERLQLMREAAVILVTSVKEGWGLIVTEANSQGTPAIVYDVDGLRDSVQHNKTGLITPSGNPGEMGDTICTLINDRQLYNSLQEGAWSLSKSYTAAKSYNEFKMIIQAGVPDA